MIYSIEVFVFVEKTEVASYIQVAYSSMDQNISENGSKDERLLPSYEDGHGGVIVELEEPMDLNDFPLILRCSLAQWKLQVIMHSLCQHAAQAIVVFIFSESGNWITVLSIYKF